MEFDWIIKCVPEFDSSRRVWILAAKITHPTPPPPQKKIPSKSKLGYTYFLALVYHIKSFTKQCKMMSLSTKAHIIIYISFLSLIFSSADLIVKKNFAQGNFNHVVFSCSFHKNSWDIKWNCKPLWRPWSRTFVRRKLVATCNFTIAFALVKKVTFSWRDELELWYMSLINISKEANPIEACWSIECKFDTEKQIRTTRSWLCFLVFETPYLFSSLRFPAPWLSCFPCIAHML